MKLATSTKMLLVGFLFVELAIVVNAVVFVLLVVKAMPA